MWGVSVVLFVTAAIFASPTKAADITLLPREVTEVGNGGSHTDIRFHLSGPITTGDADALADLIAEKLPNFFPSAGVDATISLDSPGGSFAEALELMSAFRELAIQTVVRGDAVCFSACAIAFLGGLGINEGSMGYISRTVHPGGKLGFHAPSLGVSGEADAEPDRLNDAYAIALRSIGELIRRADDYDIRDTLLDVIVSTPPDEMYTLETVDDFARWNIDVPVKLDASEIDPMALARLCTNVPTWEEGASALERDASRYEGTRNGEPFGPFQMLKDLAGKFETTTVKADGWPYPHRFHSALTNHWEVDYYCVVHRAGWSDGGFLTPRVHITSSVPEAFIQTVLQSKSFGEGFGTSRLHTLPPDFVVARLPRVPYP